MASIPAGRLGDRRGAVLVLVLGVALFGLAYAGFAAGPASVLALAPWFVAAGVAIGCIETAEHAAVAALAPVESRGSAFGLLAAVQSFGNLAASAIAGQDAATGLCETPASPSASRSASPAATQSDAQPPPASSSRQQVDCRGGCSWRSSEPAACSPP